MNIKELNYKNKGFSVITNFGCPFNCWFCIWKHHSLSNIYTSYKLTNWNLLEKSLIEIKNLNNIQKISISGGGDPLFKIEHNKQWWDTLFNLTHKLQLKIDVHTRIPYRDIKFLSKFNKIVWSCQNIASKTAEEYMSYIVKQNLNLRLVYVVMSHSFNELDNIVQQYLFIKNKYNIEVSFKKLSDYDDKHSFKYVKNKYKNSGIYFIEDKDYNIYFMPDNSITDTFLLS